jgi:hypothetical protein
MVPQLAIAFAAAGMALHATPGVGTLYPLLESAGVRPWQGWDAKVSKQLSPGWQAMAVGRQLCGAVSGGLLMAAPTGDGGISVALARGPTPHLVHEEHFGVTWPAAAVPAPADTRLKPPWAIAVAIEQRVFLFGGGRTGVSEDVVVLDVAPNCSGIDAAQPATVAPASQWVSVTVLNNSRASELSLAAVNATGLYTITITTGPVGMPFHVRKVVVEPVRMHVPAGSPLGSCQWRAVAAAPQRSTLLLARQCRGGNTADGPATLFELGVDGTLRNQLRVVAGDSSDWVGMVVADIEGSGRESIYLARAGGQQKGKCQPDPASANQMCGPPVDSSCQVPSTKSYQYGDPGCACTRTLASLNTALRGMLPSTTDQVSIVTSSCLPQQMGFFAAPIRRRAVAAPTIALAVQSTAQGRAAPAGATHSARSGSTEPGAPSRWNPVLGRGWRSWTG